MEAQTIVRAEVVAKWLDVDNRGCAAVGNARAASCERARGQKRQSTARQFTAHREAPSLVSMTRCFSGASAAACTALGDRLQVAEHRLRAVAHVNDTRHCGSSSAAHTACMLGTHRVCLSVAVSHRPPCIHHAFAWSCRHTALGDLVAAACATWLACRACIARACQHAQRGLQAARA